MLSMQKNCLEVFFSQIFVYSVELIFFLLYLKDIRKSTDGIPTHLLRLPTLRQFIEVILVSFQHTLLLITVDLVCVCLRVISRVKIRKMFLFPCASTFFL